MADGHRTISEALAMTDLPRSSRLAAALVALTAWAGLAVQLEASIGLTGGAVAALWAMARYFTVLTNLAFAITLTAVAIRGREGVGPSLLGGVTLAMLLVGVIYNLLLTGLLELSGGGLLADILLHKVTPVLAALFWLGFARKGGLRATDPWLWAIFPLAYFAYALARGAADGTYAYPFMNLARLGWPRTGLNAVVIASGFVAAGYGVVWLDGRLARRR